MDIELKMEFPSWGVKQNPTIWLPFTIDKDGTIKPVWQEKIKERSQDLEPTYFDAGQFYWATEKTFLEDSDALLSKKSLGIVLPNNRVQDIDTEDDWEAAENLYKWPNNGFNRNVFVVAFVFVY